MRKVTLLDLFSGTGGFAKGLLQAGFMFKKHYFSEIDKYAIANYQYNFKQSIHVGAVEEVTSGPVHRPDLITFGSPCQDLSVAGARRGIRGKRSRLFFEAIKILDAYKPGYFIFENVKGLLFSNEGKDFEVVLKSFADLGVYELQWQLLNTSWFLPQNRERLYVVGSLRGRPRPEVFPVGENNQAAKKSYENLTQANIAPAITLSTGTTSNREPYVVTFNKKKRAVERFLSHAKDYNLIDEIKSIRVLTPLECERLQGFPDNWTSKGIVNGDIIEISDTQRYNMLGNAVSVPVVRLIGENMKNSLGNVPGKKTRGLNGVSGLELKARAAALRLLLGR